MMLFHKILNKNSAILNGIEKINVSQHKNYYTTKI